MTTYSMFNASKKKLPVICLRNRGPLKVQNDSNFFSNNQGITWIFDLFKSCCQFPLTSWILRSSLCATFVCLWCLVGTVLSLSCWCGISVIDKTSFLSYSCFFPKDLTPLLLLSTGWLKWLQVKVVPIQRDKGDFSVLRGNKDKG